MRLITPQPDDSFLMEPKPQFKQAGNFAWFRPGDLAAAIGVDRGELPALARASARVVVNYQPIARTTSAALAKSRSA